MILLLLGCTSDGPDPLQAAMEPWPEDPEALLTLCAQQAFAELAITCTVQAAARLGQQGDAARAQEVCEALPAGLWQAECHFRAGEELGRAGHTVAGLRHCVQADRFGRNCLTHAAWRLPRDPALTSDADASVIAAAWDELSAQVQAVLAGAEDGLEGEGLDLIQARFGYNLYVGSGVADPAPARLPYPLGGALRTGFAIEAARLLSSSGPPAVEDILAVWSGQSPPPRGAALPEHARLGRYHTPILSPYEEGAPHLPVYGGGLRLSSADGDEDIAIAALEALYWLPDTRADAIAPWVDDPRPAVRRTAARLLRLTSSDVFDMEALLTKLAAEHDDAGVRWHATDGLERRSFEAPEASPPPGIPMGKPGNPRKDHP